MKKILIIVPHPDDDVLSFGGLMSKANREGDLIHVHCFCVGGPCSNVPTKTRLEEFKSVMEYFGCNYSWDEGLDGKLDQIPSCSLTGEIDELINKIKPDEVYCGANAEHSDHQALYKAFLGAARIKSGFIPKLFAVGTYPFSDQLYPSPSGGKIFNPLTEEDYLRKCNAFAMYKSQFKPSPSPLGLDGVEAQARYFGMMCGSRYAEMYYQLRYIRSL